MKAPSSGPLSALIIVSLSWNSYPNFLGLCKWSSSLSSSPETKERGGVYLSLKSLFLTGSESILCIVMYGWLLMLNLRFCDFLRLPGKFWILILVKSRPWMLPLILPSSLEETIELMDSVCIICKFKALSKDSDSWLNLKSYAAFSSTFGSILTSTYDLDNWILAELCLDLCCIISWISCLWKLTALVIDLVVSRLDSLKLLLVVLGS